jgi:guanylate kinase
VDYNFVAEQKFMELVNTNQMIEYARIHGNYYGTSLGAINIKEAIPVMDVNIDGAISIKEKGIDPFIILLLPEDMKVLESRIRGRGSETEETLNKRLETAAVELKRMK